MPETVVKNLVEELRTHGHRITKVRQACLDLLARAKSPLSAHEMIEALAARGLPVNKTTVYREVDFLIDQGLVAEVDVLEGKKRYELITEEAHHHLVCVECKNVTCASVYPDLTEVNQEVFNHHGFKVTAHVLEFFGVCSLCQEKSGQERTGLLNGKALNRKAL